MEELLFKAKIVERAECHDEMARLAREAAGRCSGDWPAELRNTIAVAYKNLLNEKRTSWRILRQIQTREQARGNMHTTECTEEYLRVVEREILGLSREAIQLAEAGVSKCAGDAIARAFLLKMRADHLRYLAELTTAPPSGAKEALDGYDKALATGIPPNHHVALAVKLNKAILLYEVLQKRAEAISLLEGTLDNSSSGGALSDDARRDASLILNAIDANLRNWKTEPAAQPVECQ